MSTKVKIHVITESIKKIKIMEESDTARAHLEEMQLYRVDFFVLSELSGVSTLFILARNIKGDDNYTRVSLDWKNG